VLLLMLQRSVLNQAVALAVVAMLQGLLCCAAWLWRRAGEQRA